MSVPISSSINRTGAEGTTTNHSVRTADQSARRSASAWTSSSCPSLLLSRSGSYHGRRIDLIRAAAPSESESDQRGMYLHVEGADGDISDADYDEDIRPDE